MPNIASCVNQQKNSLVLHLQKIFLPDYDKYGKRAPIIRNDEIISYAQYVIALWDGKSHGTAYTISKCVENGVPVRIIPLP